MEEYLSEILSRIIGLRAYDQTLLEIDLLGNLSTVELQRSRLPSCCQKLKQVSQTHCLQSAMNRHYLSVIVVVSQSWVLIGEINGRESGGSWTTGDQALSRVPLLQAE